MGYMRCPILPGFWRFAAGKSFVCQENGNKRGFFVGNDRDALKDGNSERKLCGLINNKFLGCSASLSVSELVKNSKADILNVPDAVPHVYLSTYRVLRRAGMARIGGRKQK